MNEIREPIEAKLNRPRGVFVHLSLFSIWVFIFGLITLFTPTYDVMYALQFPIIFTVLWSVILPIHGAVAFLQSSAWAPAREKAVREEVLQIAQEEAMTADEAIHLHRRLSDDLRENSFRFLLLALASLAHTAIWFGGIALLIGLSIVSGYGMISSFGFDFLALAELGSFGLGLLLPVVLLWDERRRAAGGVASFYERALKQKRRSGDEEVSRQRLMLGEDGELVDYEDESADALRKAKR